MQYLDGTLSKTYTPIPAAFTGANDILAMRTRGQVIVLVDYTKGSEAGIVLIVEMSPDASGSTWFQTTELSTPGGPPNIDVVGAVYEFDATGKYQLPVPCVMRLQRMRMQVEGKSGAGSGTVTLKVVDDSAFGTDPRLLPQLSV